jgi:hypothetical protein
VLVVTSRGEADEIRSTVAARFDGETDVRVVAPASDRWRIEDALRAFPADEIVVVTRPEEEAAWLESGNGEAARRGFDVPVTHLVVS